MSSQTVLIIGARGRMGVQLIRNAHENFKDLFSFHAFVPDPSKLSDETKSQCAPVFRGKATNVADVEKAILDSASNYFIMAIGAGDSTSKKIIRQVTAKAFVKAIQPGMAADNVHIVAVSSLGAGDSEIKNGFGIGLIIEHHLRSAIEDHNNQESALQKGMGHRAKKNLLIVRPSKLTENNAKGLDRVVQVGNVEKMSGAKIDREDVSRWIISRLTAENSLLAGAVNLTRK